MWPSNNWCDDYTLSLCPKNAPGLTSCNLAKIWRIFKIPSRLERLWNLLQNSYNAHHALSMLLHYLGKLEVQIWWILHWALKIWFILLARWNLVNFQNSVTAASRSEHFFARKEGEVSGKLEKLLQSSLRAVQFASVSSCARRLLKHFSCRSFRIMRTTDDLGMRFFRDISRTVLWVRRWSSWLDLLFDYSRDDEDNVLELWQPIFRTVFLHMSLSVAIWEASCIGIPMSIQSSRMLSIHLFFGLPFPRDPCV